MCIYEDFAVSDFVTDRVDDYYVCSGIDNVVAGGDLRGVTRDKIRKYATQLYALARCVRMR